MSGKFVSTKAREAFISYVHYKGKVEGRNKFSFLETLMEVSKDFSSRMERIRRENEIRVGGSHCAAVEDEIERPSSPGRTHEWMEEEVWPEPDYVMESNVCDEEGQSECVNEDNGYHYKFELWTEWRLEESPEKGEELRKIAARMSARRKERTESLVYDRLLMAAQYLGDEEEKELQKRNLRASQAKRTTNKEPKRRNMSKPY